MSVVDELKSSEKEQVFTLMENRIRETIGVRPLGFRAPYWRFSNHTLNIPAGGRYIYDSSLMDS